MIRLTDPKSQAFWECQVDGVAVTITSGAPGKKPRTSEKTFPDEWKADSFALSRRIEKMRAGFLYAAEKSEPGWQPTLQVALGRVHTGFQSLEFLPEQDLVLAAFARKDGQECDLVFLNARTGKVNETLTLPFFDLWQVRADPSRDCLYFRVDGSVYRLDLQSRTHHRIASTPPIRWTSAFDLSQNRSRICLADKGDLVVREVDTDQELWRTPIPAARPVTGAFNAAISPDGEQAAIAFEPGRIELCALATGQTRTLTGDFEYTSSLDFHPSSRFLAVMELYGASALHLFDLASGENVVDSHAPLRTPSGDEIRTRECHAVAFSPEGDRIFVRSRGVVVIYAFETGELLHTLQPDLVLRPQMDTGFQMLASRCPNTLVIRTDLGAILIYRHGALT